MEEAYSRVARLSVSLKVQMRIIRNGSNGVNQSTSQLTLCLSILLILYHEHCLRH